MQYLLREVESGSIPTLDYLEDDFYASPQGLNYAWGATIIEFITDAWGFEYVLEMHRRVASCDDYQELFGITREEFEHLWSQRVREVYS